MKVFIKDRLMKIRYLSRAFTLIELLVVISIIAVLMSIMMPAMSKAKNIAKRTVCSSRMKNLTNSWLVYTQDYDGSIARGLAGNSNNQAHIWMKIDQNSWQANAPRYNGWIRWYGKDNPAILRKPPYPTEDKQLQKKEIDEGALFTYNGSYDAYRCPGMGQKWMLSYTVFYPMNAEFDTADSAAHGMDSNKVVRKISKITNSSSMGVFIDPGLVTPMWGYWASPWKGQDGTWGGYPPPIRHENGTNLTFADGHAEFHNWDKDTIKYAKWANEKFWVNGRYNESSGQAPASPTADDANWMHKVTWGTSVWGK